MKSQLLPSGLLSLVDRLTALNRPATIVELRQWLADADVSRDDLTPFIRFNEICYVRNSIMATEHFELLCICWKSNQSSLIHDHVGSACGERVIVGELSETIFDVIEDSLVRPRKVNRYVAGFVCSSVDKEVHQITNHQTDGRELITLHIYSPPLAAMKSYSIFQSVDLHEPVVH